MACTFNAIGKNEFSASTSADEINAEIKERVLRAHGKLIHMAIWARPDLAHCVSVLGRYVHNPSQKHLDAYLRVARYLIKTKDLRIVYGTHDTHGLVLYGFSDSDWGADPDSYKSMQHRCLHLLLGRRCMLLEGQAQQHCTSQLSRKRICRWFRSHQRSS